jgi:hypothetical protein
MSAFDVVRNVGLKAVRRLQAAPKPLVRMMRRTAREQEHRAFRRQTDQIDRAIARLASGAAPIIVGPWLAEVGYEVLYWIPFLRWFQDAYGIDRNRLVIVSRGGMENAYGALVGRYVDIFDLITSEDLAARNRRRRVDDEGGGQKQSATSALDEELLSAVRSRLHLTAAELCHPSLMFTLFRNVWHGNLPFDLLWRRTRYERTPRTDAIADTAMIPETIAGQLPRDFIAVKLYGGPALTMGEATRDAVRALVAQAGAMAPIVLLDADVGVDEHRDVDVHDIAGVMSLGPLMNARTNLGVQIALIARSRFFLSTCGGLAWLAPFLGVPTVAVYDTDQLLAPHLFVARQAGARAGAAEFTPLDLRGLARLSLDGSAPARKAVHPVG